jgi:hypothetical protein
MTRRTKAASKLLASIPYCEYCRLPDEILPHGLWIDHIIPRAEGGANDYANLCVSCISCNQAKGTKISARDPLTDEEASLFNPRQEGWDAHFRWSHDGTIIEGLTPIGRATIRALQMNRPKLIKLRRLLIRLNAIE